MTAIHALLAGFFDYAGLYPPASLSLRSAAYSYHDYASSRQAWALGRFVINLERLDELRSIAGDRLRQFRLSVIVPDCGDGLAAIESAMGDGMPIEAVEIKCPDPESADRIARTIPGSVSAYLEVPFQAKGIAALNAISQAGMRAKIRMGGVVADAFPPPSTVIEMVSALAKLRLPFKATAGLHHPIRSSQPVTYDPQSAKSTMHGFINLFCAATVLYFGGTEEDAEDVLQDLDRTAWRVDEDRLGWRHLKWSKDQLVTVRREFFHGIGTCSFEEPIRDLEALEWL